MKAINVYLNFDGNCLEAMTFYAKCLGAELTSHSFADIPGGAPPGSEGRTMHACVSKGPLAIMASDTMPGMPFMPGNNFSISIAPDSKEETDQLFAALIAGGQIVMPLGDQFWGAYFGMLKDRFGIHWMLNCETPRS
ncbi:MAG: VOC family protein [Acidobacteria bacterium]|nr:VOC family protein [Acidobacteriota bacterium]